MHDEIKTGDYIGFDIGSGEAKTVTGIFVKTKEFERLMRLDNNVKKAIKEFKIKAHALNLPLRFSNRPIYMKIVELLESFYDENLSNF